MLALVAPFVALGVDPTDAATLGLCVASQASAIVSSGVGAGVLASLAGGACTTSPLPACPPRVLDATSSAPAFANSTQSGGTCSDPTNPCGACAASILAPFVAAGVPASSTLELAVCAVESNNPILTAGVPPASLLALLACAAGVNTLGAGPSSCPSVPPQAFAPAGAACANASNLCTLCLDAIVEPFVRKGVDPRRVAQRRRAALLLTSRSLASQRLRRH